MQVASNSQRLHEFKTKMLRITLSLCVAAAALLSPYGSRGAPSDWLEAPQPVYPLRAALHGDAGEVGLRVILKDDGHVQDATVTKSSGSTILDHEARAAVLNWRLAPRKIQSSDVHQGRDL